MAAVNEPDPVEAARRRAELAHATGGVQRLGFLVAGLGVLAAILRGTVVPGVPRLVPVVLIVAALGLMAIGSLRRIRYQWRRMRKR